MYVTNVIGTFTTAIFGTLKGDLVDNPIQDILTGLSPLTAFFLMVICAPIVEEYVFRKLIIDRTVQYGQATAILLSGLMFALFHGNFNQFGIRIYTRCVLGIHLCKNRALDLHGCPAYDSQLFRLDSGTAFNEINIFQSAFSVSGK